MEIHSGVISLSGSISPLAHNKAHCGVPAGAETESDTGEEQSFTGVLCSGMLDIPASSSVGWPPGPDYATGRCLRVEEHRVHSVGTCRVGLWDRWRPG